MIRIPLRSTVLLGLAALVLFAAPAVAAPTFEFMPGNWAVSDLSADGMVAAGTSGDGLSEAMRWTPADGLVRLGMSSASMTGKGGGTCDISADGLRVSGTTGTLDSLYATPGRWTKGVGWERMIASGGPGDPAECDGHLGSAWGISGDGLTVVGLHWIGCTGHGFSWTEDGGLVDLLPPNPNTSSRADDANYDGSVIVGWTSHPTQGAWRPSVWENGVLTVLDSIAVGNTATCVTPDGTMIGGSAYDESTGQNASAVWIKDQTGWQRNILGVLPGTFAGYGRGYPNAISADGSIIVGFNRFDWSFGTGFVWTLEQGLMSAADYFTFIGVPVPEGFNILSLSAVSEDGRVIAGYGVDGNTPGAPIESFRVELYVATDAPPVLANSAMKLLQAHPNPFNPSTTLSLVLDRDGSVQLNIYDGRGRLVRRLHDGAMSAGQHQLSWDGRDDSGSVVTSGVYMARASGDDGVSNSQKLTLLK